MYAFSENFVLPISHDEVVHGKGSLLRKARGTREEQLATLRAFLAHMWAHPGKQLVFMGCEFAQESEWAEGRSLDWWLLDQPAHYRVHALVKDLNALYVRRRELWELDRDPAGFLWLNADDAGHNTFSYLRFGSGDARRRTPRCSPPSSTSAAAPTRATGSACRAAGAGRSSSTRPATTRGALLDRPRRRGRGGAYDGQPYACNLVVPKLSAVWLVPLDEATPEPLDAPLEETVEGSVVAGSPS